MPVYQDKKLRNGILEPMQMIYTVIINNSKEKVLEQKKKHN